MLHFFSPQLVEAAASLSVSFRMAGTKCMMKKAVSHYRVGVRFQEYLKDMRGKKKDGNERRAKRSGEG